MWYIIPAERIRGQGSIALYPKLKNSKYEPYREAWHRLQAGTKVASIHACEEQLSVGTMLPVLERTEGWWPVDRL